MPERPDGGEATADGSGVPNQSATDAGLIEQGNDGPRRTAAEALVMTIIAIAVVAVAYWLLLRRFEAAGFTFHEIANTLQFAGSNDRLEDELPRVSLTDARYAVVGGLLFALVWSATGFVLLSQCWDTPWRTGYGRAMKGEKLGLALAAGGGGVAVVEKVLTLLVLTDDPISYRSWVFAPVIAALAWIKWLLAGLLICAVTVMAVSVATRVLRRKLPDPDPSLIIGDGDDGSDPVGRDKHGIGICCSGGGIRAAAFALGCLSRLEEPLTGSAQEDGGLGVLGRASYLASVSGGGYAASAWRIAAGTGELPPGPIIGNPFDPERQRRLDEHQEEEVPGALDLFDHIRERRHFLATGPGGLLRSLIRAIAHTAFHFFLVLATVFLIAWPLGRIIVGWAVTDVGLQPDAIPNGLSGSDSGLGFGVHQWFPPVALLGVALLAMVDRLNRKKTGWRSKTDLVIKSAAGMAGLLFMITIGLPWAVDRFIVLVPNAGGDQFALAGIYGVIVTAAWQFTKDRLRPMARYLGGVLLAIGLFAFALYVMASAADTNEPLSSHWWWLGSAALMTLAFVFFNPDRWSLHSIYRDGLTGTFAAVLDRESGTVYPLDPSQEPPLAAYRQAHGPQPVVCCAAARKDNQQTGMKVLSMTFDPESIVVQDWQGTGPGAASSPKTISHAEFHRRLPKNPLGGRSSSKDEVSVTGDKLAVRTAGYGLHTMMGAVAVSGAAVAPSLGRMDMKSTNALLAAFNARLGVWVPNPRTSYERSTTPRVYNMFKEILGMYNDDDPNVYATDGGHWENLGLVELIRRRCRLIICIDASGDPPGSYQALHDAIELADLECEAKVDLSEGLENDLKTFEGQRPQKNYAAGRIEYNPIRPEAADATAPAEAKLIYVKAAVAASSPIHIRRYAASDKRFPNYSTGDQLLDEDEFVYLVQLGYDSMNQALEESVDAVSAALP